MTPRVAVPWTQVGGCLGWIRHLVRYTALADTPQGPEEEGGGAFPPLRNAKGFRSRYLEEGGSLRSNLERLSGRDPERN